MNVLLIHMGSVENITTVGTTENDEVSDNYMEVKKNTDLMLDSFTFSVAIPGELRSTNASLVSDSDNTLYWSFEFSDIATNHFNMYAHSIVINNLVLQLFFLLIVLFFIGFIWKKRLKKDFLG